MGLTLEQPCLATEERTLLVPMYKVLIHNDNCTPAEFVVVVLATVFRLAVQQAVAVMLEAHETGVALVVVEPLERAEFHVEKVRSLARPRGYPLALSIEEA